MTQKIESFNQRLGERFLSKIVNHLRVKESEITHSRMEEEASQRKIFFHHLFPSKCLLESKKHSSN